MFISIMYVTYTYIHTNMYKLYVHFCVSVCNTSAFTFPQSAVVHSRRRSNSHQLDIYFECMCSVNKKVNACTGLSRSQNALDLTGIHVPELHVYYRVM